MNGITRNRVCGSGGEGSEDEESAIGTGLEARAFGFPIGGYRFFLDMDKREPLG